MSLATRIAKRATHDCRRLWHEQVLPARTGARTFVLDGVEYAYGRHRHHPMWSNERAVEIPVALAAVSEVSGSMLEVGNVLNWYSTVSGHVVVDKYERGTGVTNADVVDFNGGPFDFILGISTIEHVGWDEKPIDMPKAGRAIDHLVTMVAPGGKMLLTLPVGYRRDLDEEVAGGRWGCDVTYLARSAERVWEQVDAERALSTMYGFPFIAASAVSFLRWG